MIDGKTGKMDSLATRVASIIFVASQAPIEQWTVTGEKIVSRLLTTQMEQSLSHNGLVTRLTLTFDLVSGEATPTPAQEDSDDLCS